jgi:copper chaperone CopZ
MNRLKVLFIVLVVALFSHSSNAQFVSAEIGVDGLTCSACTRSVEMSIRKLDFVADVQMNLENTLGTITFKAGSAVDIEKLAKAVVNAGFSVRYLNAVYKADSSLQVADNYCMSYNGANYQFVKVSPTKMQNITMKFIGKEFLPAKEYKVWKDSLKAQCTGSKSTYFVTL